MRSDDDRQHESGEHGREPPARPSTTSAPSFDLSTVSRSVWISAGGALVLLISVFLSWYTATASIKVANVSQSFSASESGWNSGAAAKFVALLALIALASVGTTYGVWIALLAAIAVVVGAYLRMTEPQS